MVYYGWWFVWFVLLLLCWLVCVFGRYVCEFASIVCFWVVAVILWWYVGVVTCGWLVCEWRWFVSGLVAWIVAG